ncbi:hypothetical protein JCM3766R1_003912 [Sporobolomyces carnicolor]
MHAQRLVLVISMIIASSLQLVHAANGAVDFFRSLQELAIDDLDAGAIEHLHNLVNALPSKDQTQTREIRYKDRDGFDCHETFSTSYGTLDDATDKEDVDKKKKEKTTDGAGSIGNLLTFQKRSDGVEEEDKVPDFVVKDGFFDHGPNESEWFAKDWLCSKGAVRVQMQKLRCYK